MQCQNPFENGPLLLPSLRFIIPPLRLVSAAMWQVVQQGHVQDYGMLEEFVTTVTEIVPEILSFSQRAQLILGLRASMVLELCRSAQTADQEIQQHLDRIRSLISFGEAESSDAEVRMSESKFVELVESLLKDPSERDHFYQDVFPMEFGPQYDTAIQMLMLEFLTRLEKLLPIPDLEQTASLLNAVPSALEQCVQSVPDPRQLRTLLQYHRKLGHLESVGETRSSVGDCIFSSLHLSPRVCVVSVTGVDSDAKDKYLVAVEKNERLLAPEERQGDIYTDKEPALDREAVSLETQKEAVTGVHFQLKKSKRLQIKEMLSKGQKASASSHAVRQPSSSKMQPHLKKSHKRALLNKTCSVCGRTFARATAMRRHQQSHAQNHDLKFKCLKCGFCFKDLYDLKNHQQGVCERELHILDNNEVEDIQHPSTSKPVLTSPLKSPAPPELLPRKVLDTKTCSLCGRFFTRTSDMARHMRSHSKERPFWCISCDKSFKYSYDLKRHQRDLCKKRNLEDVSQDDGNNLSQQIEDLQPEKAECQSVERSVSLATDQNQIPNSNVQPSNKEPLDSKTCYVCGRILTRTSDMERHLKSHSKERPFHCGTCERSFKYKDTLKKHQQILGHEGILEDFGKKVVKQQLEVKMESGIGLANTKKNDTVLLSVAAPSSAPTLKEPKPCGVCGKVFNRASGMAIHMRSHSSERPYRCVSCEQCFKYLHGLKKHQRDICLKMNQEEGSNTMDVRQEGSSKLVPDEADDTPVVNEEEERKEVLKCDECGKEFKGPSCLRIHKRIHSPFYCSDCGRTYPNSVAFGRHKLMHKAIRCTMCEKTFTLLGRLREHYLHEHKFSGPFPCLNCDKTFAQLSYLVVHERVHSGEYPYQCSVCPGKFRTANSLTIHSRKHTGEKPFLCWQCGKSYRAASELAVHMGTHSEEKPFSCSQCDMTYRTKTQMNTHIEQVHDGVRFTCTVCRKQFLKEMSLKRHELTHTGERPYPCSYCEKTFITANERRLHERYHTGERPYKCQECGKSFIQSGYLKSHQRLHTGEKPFPCNVCDKRFRFSHHMKRHQRTHTADKHMCGKCGVSFTRIRSLKAHELTHSVNEN
ncbi:zinc finger protein 14-like isoform X4 [Esox lucius]|uniref:zinc finger protein 14-like isoform X4 n=1 Tax=Esox lucius TaxID=8010 RepID=UPI0014777C7C|nr:zinc finger protein 14-like isoform X4 [Esox lucius]